MCLQGKETKWAKNVIRILGFAKNANNCEEFKIEPISVEKENIKVGNLLKLQLTKYCFIRYWLTQAHKITFVLLS